VGLRSWFIEMLSKGNDTSDPEELVDFRIVPLPSGPLLVHAMQESGIEAFWHECWGPTSTQNQICNARVMVRRCDLAEALARHGTD